MCASRDFGFSHTQLIARTVPVPVKRHTGKKTHRGEPGNTLADPRTLRPRTSAPPGTLRGAVTVAVGLAPSLLPSSARLGAVATTEVTTTDSLIG